jgi:myo-inositol 2-dehydrogenase/D-chiro-inositol 1-dehydrogenase
MLDDAIIDAVVISTPADSHRAIAEAALKAGKHIFVEKPLAGTLADAEAIVRAAGRAPVRAQAGFCERFNPQYLEAKRAVDAGVIGSIRAIQSSRVAPYSLGDPAWELGILDTAVHNLDLILWLMQRQPVSVRCFGAHVYADSLPCHSATTLLLFEDGALATDHVAWLRDDRHPLHECARSSMRIIGAQGVFEVDLTGRPSSLLTDAVYRQIDSVIIGGPDYYGCLKLQFEAFLRSIEENQPVQAPLSDALLAERVVIAASESLKTGKEVTLL